MKRDYTSKTVYVGIDVHKKSYSVFCICEEVKVKNWRMRAEAEQLIEQLKRYFVGAKIKTVYEAGFSGNGLHRALIEEGIESIIVNPGSVEVASRDRVKTDKRDAKKLAEQLASKRLKCIYIPSEQEERARLLTRLRTTLLKDRTRMACRIKSKLLQFGYLGPDDEAVVSQKWIKEQAGKLCGYCEELAYVLEYYFQEWLRLTEEIKAKDKKIAEHTKKYQRFAGLEKIYKSAPGLGDISARELSRELGDLSQFKSAKGVYSYTGLTPSESSSGEKRRQGSISHCGRPRIRHLLIEIAWRSILKDQSLLNKFNELAPRRGKKRAIVAVGRILIGRLRFCLMNGVFYEIEPLTDSKEVLVT